MSFQDKLIPIPAQSGAASSTIPGFQAKLKPLAAAAPAEEQDGFWETLIKDPIKTLLVKPAVRAGQAIGVTGLNIADKLSGGKLDEIARRNTGQGLQENISKTTDKPVTVPYTGITVEPQKKFDDVGYVEGGKQIAGDALKSAGYIYSGGKLPTAAGKLFTGQFAKSAAETGVIGAIGGGAYGAGDEMQKADSTIGSIATRAAEDAGLGLLGGALLGGGVPALGKALRTGVRESVGLSTGTGGSVITQAYKSAKEGGAGGQAFKEALRGRGSEEQLVLQARDALDTIVAERSAAYKKQRAILDTGERAVDTIEPIINAFNKQLEDYGVTFTKGGRPDFSRSPGLGRYEKDLGAMSKVLADWGSKEGDFTVIGIDNLKQVLDDFRIGSSDSRKFDAFVTNLRNQAKTLIKNKPGYQKLVKDYEESTGLIKEIQRGLSLGDKASVDTAFRKLTSSLRTNNEFRKQLVEELDRITEGKLLGGIAGQQLSQAFPRGLVKPLGAVGGVATLAATGGGALIPLILAALTTSPRLVGEILRLLGMTVGQISKLMKIISHLKPSGPSVKNMNTNEAAVNATGITKKSGNLTQPPKSPAVNKKVATAKTMAKTKPDIASISSRGDIMTNLPQRNRSVKGVGTVGDLTKKKAIGIAENYDLLPNEAKAKIRELFNEDEMSFAINKEAIDGKADGMFTRNFRNLIEIVENEGRVSSDTLYHEAFHGYFNTFIPQAERDEIIKAVRSNLFTGPGRAAKALSGYKGKFARAEEWLADDFANYVRGKSKSKLAGIWERILAQIRTWIRKTGQLDTLYDDIFSKKRTGFIEKQKLREPMYKRYSPGGD